MLVACKFIVAMSVCLQLPSLSGFPALTRLEFSYNEVSTSHSLGHDDSGTHWRKHECVVLKQTYTHLRLPAVAGCTPVAVVVPLCTCLDWPPASR
jgi:hypothetical protein